MTDHPDAEDILNDSMELLGGEPIVDNEVVTYGVLSLKIAPKEGKANSLLADHLFSPALFLAERIERGLLSAHRRTVLELGSGSGLPSLLLATTEDPPSLVTITDYPDIKILDNLRSNIEANKAHVKETCRVECVGYDWGTDAEVLLKILPRNSRGYDVMILSDLLYFHTSHDKLVTSIQLLLCKSSQSLVHVSAGNYTHPDVCNNFLMKARNSGLVFEEVLSAPGEEQWKGEMQVNNFTKEYLALRKSACRYWVGRWT